MFLYKTPSTVSATPVWEQLPYVNFRKVVNVIIEHTPSVNFLIRVSNTLCATLPTLKYSTAPYRRIEKRIFHLK